MYFGRPGCFSRVAPTLLIFATANLLTCGSGRNPG
jgi:hypothetical protein